MKTISKREQEYDGGNTVGEALKKKDQIVPPTNGV